MIQRDRHVALVSEFDFSAICSRNALRRCRHLSFGEVTKGRVLTVPPISTLLGMILFAWAALTRYGNHERLELVHLARDQGL